MAALRPMSQTMGFRHALIGHPRFQVNTVHHMQVHSQLGRRNGGRHPEAYPRRAFDHQKPGLSQSTSAVSGESISNTFTLRFDLVSDSPWKSIVRIALACGLTRFSSAIRVSG